MEILKALRPIEEFERKLALFYEWCGRSFVDDYETSSFFYCMKVEEESNINLVQYIRRIARQNPLLFGEVDLNMDGIQESTSKMARLMSSTAEPSLEDVLNAALEIERNATDFYGFSHISEAGPGIAQLVGSLQKSFLAHYETLAKFRAKQIQEQLIAG
ncbi:MAG: hypothetical protein HZA20_14525 [Nitrospirae bacterium]|nr:hypothetical protein [Nitrospirota bacterium]